MPRFGFAPVYLLATLKTIGMGIMSAAVSSLLILEMGQPAWIAGVLGAVYNLGFVLFIVFLGNLADRMPRHKALRLLLTFSVITSILRLLPLSSPENIAIFGIFHFLEGGACGLFWCVVQSYAFVAHRVGEKARDGFLSGYNFSWNVGVIGGYLLGTVFVPMAGTNYIAFWINFINAFISGVLVFASVKDVRVIESLTPEESLPKLIASPLENESPDTSALRMYAPYLVLFFLLVHSFADGSLTVLGPLKIRTFALDSTSVYILFLVKYTTQTIASALGPRVRISRLPLLLQIMPLGIALSWVYFGFAGDFWSGAISLALSGMTQGFLYAAGLKYLAQKAQHTSQNKMFAHFQITMGSGRALGPFIMGLVAEVSFPFGIGTLAGLGIIISGVAIIKRKMPRNADAIRSRAFV